MGLAIAATAACGPYNAVPVEANPEAMPDDAVVTLGSGKDLPITSKVWSKLNDEEKYKFMQSDIMPAMALLFSTYDNDHYGKMTCETCHGTDPKSRKWAMPNPDLAKLDPSNGFQAWQEKSPKAVKFMAQDVTPSMAQLLSMKTYDPKTGKGFGCMACHTGK
jgi:hypothetical protein